MISDSAKENVRTLLREVMDTWIRNQYDELQRIEAEGV